VAVVRQSLNRQHRTSYALCRANCFVQY